MERLNKSKIHMYWYEWLTDLLSITQTIKELNKLKNLEIGIFEEPGSTHGEHEDLTWLKFNLLLFHRTGTSYKDS